MSGIGKIIPSTLRNIGNKIDVAVRGLFLKAKAKNTALTPETNQAAKAEKKGSGLRSTVWNMIKNKLAGYRSARSEKKQAKAETKQAEAKQKIASQEAKRLVNTIVDKASMLNVILYLKGASQDVRNAMVAEAKIATQDAIEDGKMELVQTLESFTKAIDGGAKALSLQTEAKRFASTITDQQSALQLEQFLNQASPDIREATVDAARVRAALANESGDSELAVVLDNFASTIEGQGARELNLQAEARRLVGSITDEKTSATLTLFLYQASQDIRDSVVVEARSKAQHAVDKGDTQLAQTLLDFAVVIEDRVDIAMEHRTAYLLREAGNLVNTIVDSPSMMQAILFLKGAGANIRQASVVQARETAAQLVDSGNTERSQLLLDFAVAIDDSNQTEDSNQTAATLETTDLDALDDTSSVLDLETTDLDALDDTSSALDLETTDLDAPDETTSSLETTDLDTPNPDSTSALDELFNQLDEEKAQTQNNQRTLAKTLLDKATDQASIDELAQDLKQLDGEFLQVVADEAWAKLDSLKLSGNTSLTEPLLELINNIESTSLVRRLVESIYTKPDMLALVVDLEAAPPNIRQNVINEAKLQAAKANSELGGILLELVGKLENL